MVGERILESRRGDVAKLQAPARRLDVVRGAQARPGEQAFAGVQGVSFVKEPKGTVSNYWLNAILLDDESGKARDAVLQATHDAGLLTRPTWTLMHRLAMFQGNPRSDLSVSESIERRLVNLPSSAILGMNDVA